MGTFSITPDHRRWPIERCDRDTDTRSMVIEHIGNTIISTNIRNNRDMPEMSGKKSIGYDNISGLPHDEILKTIWDDLIHEDSCYTTPAR